MIPELWYAPLPSYVWRVTLHSCVAGALFFAWARHHRLRSGAPKRVLLQALLLLPLLTAALPGRVDFDFREQVAWFDSMRVLALPLLFDFHVQHLVLLVGGLSTLLTLGQEVLPMLRRRHPGLGEAPRALVGRARRLPGLTAAQIGVIPTEHILVSTWGRPSRPVVALSRGALDRLGADGIDAALRHEAAHWRRGRWWWTHFLYLVRMLQPWNPAVLWAFREYLIEVEIQCDAEAVAGQDRRSLIRTLLRLYEEADEGVTRRTLRIRVDTLRRDRPGRGRELTPESVAVACALLVVLLPWLV